MAEQGLELRPPDVHSTGLVIITSILLCSSDAVVMSHRLPALPGPSKLVGKYVGLGTFGPLYILQLLMIVITYSHLGKRLCIQIMGNSVSAHQILAHYQKRKRASEC